MAGEGFVQCTQAEPLVVVWWGRACGSLVWQALWWCDGAGHVVVVKGLWWGYAVESIE